MVLYIVSQLVLQNYHPRYSKIQNHQELGLILGVYEIIQLATFFLQMASNSKKNSLNL